ncbi:hypothetical protein ACFW9F_00550 [Streptomyces sp. NPDC059506]|uniref:hypothetical protein n=1 Tax=Streptomyces sp. NPDC059506 TaxID=3347751 RepID=UPI00368F645B
MHVPARVPGLQGRGDQALEEFARRWLTIADRYMECRIGAPLDDVAWSVPRCG